MALSRGAFLMLLLGISCRQRAGADSAWSYTGPQGEDHWASSYPYCGDVQQSPIDFHSGIFTYSPALEPIQLMGYNLSATQKLSLTNDGHAVKVSLPPTMHIISMSHRYTAVQLHLHWGSETDPVGSEHTISGRHYPSEMHIVHYNSEKYENASVAQDKVDGLAVLGILIQIGPFNAAYNHIFQHLKEIQHKDEEILIPGFNINDLLPRQLYEYFRYNGSLTTPPCYPSVQWTVFREPVQISSEQLLELESDLYFSNTTEKNQMGMVNNYRHVQELGEREVLISFPEAVNAGHTLTPGGVLIIALCCVLCIVSAFSLTVFFLKKRARKTTETRGVIYTAASAEDGPSEA
ncbi:carbonic anhydrase 12 [Pristis pectinata]|uniref:carbonic anhydrase 12 n=1 Tax=Pristis pectinata TaxID=685728 RepID=UPI00223D1393|nr:carbonic anhydrase 12 [Pristis pectinata]